MTSKRESSTNRSLKRKVGTRRLKKVFRLYCEGRRTEPEYFEALKRQDWVRRDNYLEIRIANFHGAPKNLVDRAIEDKVKFKVIEDGEDDEYWCVFDAESPIQDRKVLISVQRSADQGGVNLAISNPCFEIWLLLHLEECRKALSTEEACRLRRARDGSSDKGIDPGKYVEFIEQACERAKENDRRHVDDGIDFPDNNPSSGMYKLIDALIISAERSLHR
ncbi:MAG: RloB family protein [Actinomycetota bacterium]|nr:RloB family protein [Actinomycetota bacterium]MDA8196995.1 RloB family protein [Actinomycetota bacterium]